MIQISASFSSSNLSLDSWSGMYVGCQWAAEHELPPEQWQFEIHHGPLCQMLILSSHHLVELMLFKCLRHLLDASPGKFPKYEKDFSKKAIFSDAFTKWPLEITGQGFHLQTEPFKSASALHLRRNATIHKESALASLAMARSALFSATQASRSICEQLLGPSTFEYEEVLAKYPVRSTQWFSKIKFLERFSPS
ncbi:hypothetical protein ABIE13_003782 [Ottowia thiooxydans]|uniref:Uncharacterized protein n=2 Tax=Ottowia thiooxydans TaxID=219182 RepID=A0ABV2QC99_9BURK